MNNTPPVTKNLIIINLLCFLATWVLGREAYGINLNDILGMHFCGAEKFNLYQIFTYMFMHADFGHLFFNMFALYMFGRVLEVVWGSKRFLLFYIVAGVGAALAGALNTVNAKGSIQRSGALSGSTAWMSCLKPPWCGSVR